MTTDAQPRKSAMFTLEDQHALYKGKTSGFDYLRIGLAVGVLAWHSFGLTYGRAAIDGTLSHPAFRVPINMILPMFFALSGFLVTASLYRTRSIKVYLTFRALRIVPALSVEITLAALVLGPLLTVFALSDYFSDARFYKYFLNIVGLVQYELPGLFLDNPYPAVVNGSLWTLPYELECYVYLMLFFMLGMFRSRYFVLLAFAIVTVIVVQLGFTSTKGVIIAIKNLLLEASDLEPNLQRETGTRIELDRILVLSFFAGSVLYAWRESIPFSAILAALSAVIAVVFLLSPTLYFYSPLFIGYFTIWLGLLNPAKWALLEKGDYSYGIYLYAFPVQQAVAMSGLTANNYVLHFLLSLAIVSVFAVFSWHVIEKPFLALKRHFL